MQPKGWHIAGTARDETKRDALAAAGITPVAWTGDAVAEALTTATDLLISVGPDEAGDPSLALCGDAIRQAAPNLTWAGYLSTTGVYGDHQGGWVDEDTALTPATVRGKRRVAAEAEWQAIPNLPLHIFRLAGIYGPGRGPFAKVRAGTARRIIKQGQVFSRIHVEDIARYLEASLNAPTPGEAYNLCDDDPAPPQDVIAHAADLLGLPCPPGIPYEEAEFTPMARSFYAESKRVSNQKAKDTFGIGLAYPTYKDGLAALLEQERA
ncbi:hypothetical protein PRI8871_01512 [Pseudoprimorskyibacter insulae]|uniref:NAD-dependent epimerase/dehydratase domain-containing protein n=1 Tax=Pseudoprimorskyibacter insulae TaxID=1695997 RepID=A0A2R8AUK3_9RHOB|nr:hypothetical protein PRI8871_01512 [Pseudoprimorskyibacter insulae]